MDHIVKRRSRIETFDERKVYASCYAACIGAHVPKERAEAISETVVEEVREWIFARAETTSEEIFHMVFRSLENIHADAARMYKATKQ